MLSTSPVAAPRGANPARRHCLRLLLLLLWCGAAPRAHALQGLTGVHDPSTIVKQGNTYWVFATGQGIYSLYSTDLVNWTPGPRAVFVNNAYPGWINTKVPGFAGNFWAPECVFQNGKYYLYYSCSTFGSKVSAIGLATNVTLDPASPSYNWVDEGEVISTNANSPVNAIDPAVYRDASNNLWMTYGSYFGGIRTVQLDAATGKPLAGATQNAVANGDVEAAYVARRGAFYYLFINRGTCCQGISSTYRILVGRSASPAGPFLDQNGVDLNANGGTLLLSGAGRYRGPGHTGIFEENGATYFSHHYYDSYDNGAPKLGLAQLTWSAAGWPVVSRDWLGPASGTGAAGRFTIAAGPAASNLVWQSQGCTGAAGQAIVQATPAAGTCQQWDFTALGNGDYKITSALGGLAAGTANCSDANFALLQLGTYTGQDCQQFHLDRASDGSLVLAALSSNRVVEVPFASTAPGAQLGIFDYNGCACQHWFVTPVGTTTATAGSARLAGVSLYPVPAERGAFTVDLGPLPNAEATTVTVTDLLGKVVYCRRYGPQQRQLAVAAGLAPGIYQVRVQRGAASLTQKQTVQ
ncbi:family 43 glycosylhydrolase [Hymenobacter armeniacus]|uniref:Family 43 glycosylhydrolase n=1 Tax=Hymenobacter armeniacus TaxID=2771358 RepID=A0ABR8K0P8_9BACT|nr:family 43 glycosylhydrolase [Hymenobacter armeniacus]MBD2724645.1 family 43 glycosylhydrolase [Hymenobacter armeniacus]